ncbi:MAG: ATP synthase A1 subunit C [Methanobacteriota archaeon]|nr:MAG: ATP synthase A1 subunit C [Euryarchaeota archaeon]
MAALTGPAPYIYVGTRLRVRKTKLIPREEYLRMLNMSLPEITRLIQETEYKREIDELATSFGGINLIEVALSWNLAKTYQNVLAILPAGLKEMTESYLRRWDIQNVLTILRGKAQGLAPGRIKEVLIPAGELDRVTLDRLLAVPSPEKIVEALKGWRLYPVLLREYKRSVETDSFAHLENELYKQLYAEIIADTQAGVRGGREFLGYVKLEIDIRNLQNLFRLREQRERGDITGFMIPGGSFTIEELQQLAAIETLQEFLDILRRHVRNKPLLAVIEDAIARGLFQQHNLHEVEIALTRVQLRQMEFMAKLHPFTIWPILDFLELKKYEIFNLRAITRGKESNLPTERIKNYLVM